jgi:Flp pilus assembly protein TadB
MSSERVSDRIGSMVDSVGNIRTGLGALSTTSGANADGLQRLSGRVTTVSDDTNTLLQHFAESGVEMIDSPYIAFGLDASREILLVRHFWTFLVYFASLVCFYLLCRRLFPSRLYALVGTLMVFLYPRFFAQSFYNIKDIVFCALLMMAIYACVVFLQEGRNTRHAIAAGFLTALAAN